MILGLLVLSSCNYFGGHRVRGNGTLATQDRPITDFNGVSVVGGMEVVLVPGTTFGVKVEADQNLLEYIETRKDGSTLVIAPRKGYNLHPEAGLKIYVSAPELKSFEISGRGSITSQSKLSYTQNVKTEVNGSGDLSLEIDAPEIASEITGNGNIVLKGHTRTYAAEINGNGEVHGFDLQSENAKVEINGSGDAEVYASKELGIEINGSGGVSYKGNPPTVNQHVSGSGDIRKM